MNDEKKRTEIKSNTKIMLYFHLFCRIYGRLCVLHPLYVAVIEMHMFDISNCIQTLQADLLHPSEGIIMYGFTRIVCFALSFKISSNCRSGWRVLNCKANETERERYRNNMGKINKCLGRNQKISDAFCQQNRSNNKWKTKRQQQQQRRKKIC